MNNYLKFIEDEIKKNLNVEKIKVIDNSFKHKSHKFFDIDKYHLCLEIESKYLKSLFVETVNQYQYLLLVFQEY